jgi:predicted transcriptional regulator of viral defense system
MSEAKYGQTQGLALIHQVVEASGPIFTMAEAQAHAEGSGVELRRVPWLLSRLGQGGWVSRLKRGVYVAQAALFGAEIHPFAVAAALAEPIAISHWSALAHHGFTTQIPPMVQASTPRAVVTPDMRLGAAYRPRGRAVWRALGLEFEFITVRPHHFFGFEHEWVSQWHRVAITDPERTILDMIAHPRAFGGVSFAIETLEAQLATLNLDRLVEYALRYDVGAVIKRLGWILATLGAPDSALAPLRAHPVRNYYLLDPSGSLEGTPVPEWRIRDNLRREALHANR